MATANLVLRAQQILGDVLGRGDATGKAAGELVDEIEPKLPFLADHLDENGFFRCLFLLARAAILADRVDFLARNYEVLRVMYQVHALENPHTSYLMLGVLENELGKLALESRNYEVAIKHFQQSLECDDLTNDLNGRQDSLLNLGLALQGARRFEGALSCFDRAIAEFPNNGNEKRKTLLHANKGETLAHLERWKEARDALEFAYACADSNALTEMKECTAWILATVCAKLGDHSAADKYNDIWIRLSARKHLRP